MESRKDGIPLLEDVLHKYQVKSVSIINDFDSRRSEQFRAADLISDCRILINDDEYGIIDTLVYYSIVDNHINISVIDAADLTRHFSKILSFIARYAQIKALTFEFLHMDAIPATIKDFYLLEELHVNENKKNIDLPVELVSLKKLRFLDLSHNDLDVLPREVTKLKHLEELDLSFNNLEALPEEILSLKKLKRIDLESKEIKIPPEIQSANPSVTIQYFLSYLQQTKKKQNLLPLHEAKILLVGQGSVGKTSLARRILGRSYNAKQAKTDGIVINQWHIKDMAYRDMDYPIQVNMWDFGGQEIMHATHQFFFSKRSLYLLVIDCRLTLEENRLDYWLKLIESFSNDSPIIIVGNKTDQHPLDIDRTGLSNKYPNIKGILDTSAATGAGIKKLREAISVQINNLSHIRELIPSSWFKIQAELEKLGRSKNFISYDDFLALCNENEVTEEKDQHILLGFMHDFGVILYFQNNPRLESFGILNPQWVTKGVYKILNSRSLFENKGLLTVSMLDEILVQPEYPRGKRIYIIDMMKEFELCYDLEANKTFLVPGLLPKDEPTIDKWEEALAFQYHYAVFPTSVITRFIVRMNQFIYEEKVWRSGVVLKNGKNTALVKADAGDKKIYILVSGTENTRRDFLSAIRSQFSAIHDTIAKLEVREKVPVFGQDKILVDYAHLLNLEKLGETTYIPEGFTQRVDIHKLLNGIESESQRKEKNVINNYNYYSASDGGIIVGRNLSGNLISGNQNKIIQNIYNKVEAADISPKLKQTMKQLIKAVEKMNESLSARKASQTSKHLGKLADEVIKSKPKKKWYSVSIEGLIEAAENLDKLGKPVINLSRKVLSLLTSGIIK